MDLIFTSQPNLIMESGVYSSLHSNCHHQEVFAEFNLSILYPPHYKRTEKANPELMRRAINEFDWIRALSNVSINKESLLVHRNAIIHNFIPHERIVCDNRDPPWMNNEIKKLINETLRRICFTNNNTTVLIEMCFFSKSLNFCKID